METKNRQRTPICLWLRSSQDTQRYLQKNPLFHFQIRPGRIYVRSTRTPAVSSLRRKRWSLFRKQQDNFHETEKIQQEQKIKQQEKD